MQMSMLVLMLLPGYYSWTVTFVELYIFNDFVAIVQKVGSFKIVFLILGCRKKPFKVNDKRNVLLLYLLDRHIPLQITPNNSRSQVTFSAPKIPSTLLEGRVGWVDVVGIHIFFEIGKDHY